MSILMNYFVPLIPDSAPIVINVNQYDYDDPSYDGRLVFNLIYEGLTYDLTGASASIQGTKPDGTAFAYDCQVSGSVVRAKLTQQMTAVYGRATASVIIIDGDGNRIGSFAVWLEVQQSAIDGSAPASQTEIPTLIALATAQAQAAQQSATQAEAAANAAAAWSANPPYIGLNGDWYVYNKDTGLYEDSGVNAVGREGSIWYSGTAVSGKSSTPTAFPTGIAAAHVGDMYLNWSEGAIYECTTAGDPTTALWKYGMTLSGGGGAGVLADLHDVQLGILTDGDLLMYDQTAGKWVNAQLAAVAYTNDYGDLNNQPVIPDALAGLTADVLITSPTNNQALVYDGTAAKWKNQAIPGGGGHNMLDNSDLLNEMQVALTEGVGNDDVVSGYGVGTWSNVAEHIYGVTKGAALTSPIGQTGIGQWDDESTFSGWLTIAELIGISAEDFEVAIGYDPTTFTGPKPILGGYKIEDTTGKICIKFANEIDAADVDTAKIYIIIRIGRLAVSWIP